MSHNRQVCTCLQRCETLLKSFLGKTGWTTPSRFLSWLIINTLLFVHLSGSRPFYSCTSESSTLGSWIEDSDPAPLPPSHPRIPPPSACELWHACEQKLLSDPQDDRVTLSRHRGCVNVWFWYVRLSSRRHRMWSRCSSVEKSRAEGR